MERVVDAFRRTIGQDNLVPMDAKMTAEDFARYGRTGVPIFMFRLGTIAPDRLEQLQKTGGPPSLHSGLYYPDPRESLRTGIHAMTTAVLELLPRSDGGR